MDRLEAEAAPAGPTADELANALPDVLVVDDDDKNLKAVAALLSELPCRLVLARSGVEALKILMRQDVAVILLDVQMPGMDGLELAEMVRSRVRSRRTPIIFLTAFSRTDAQLRRAYQLGAVDFLTKPIQPAEVLRDKVAWFVDSRRAAMLLEAERVRARAAEQREHERAVENAKRMGEAEALRSEMERQKQLLERLNLSNERLRALSSIANELLVQPTVEAIPRVFERLSSHLGLEVYLLHLAEPNGGLALRAHAGVSTGVLEQVQAMRDTVFSRAAARRAPIVVPDVAHASEPPPSLRVMELSAAAVFPLLAAERLIGTLGFGTRKSAWFEPDELSALEIIADEVAMALERERLIDELKRRADDLAQADRRKDQFLAMLAHELRNPLAPILNAVEILRRRELSPAAGRRALDAADRQVRHLARLVGDLVDVSRIRTGKVELRREPVDLSRIVDDAVSAIEPLAREQRHELAVDLPLRSIFVDADAVRLTQVVENLLHNAAKYTDAGGHIRLAVADEDGAVVIRVSDDGMGIAADLLPRVFDTFVQGEQPSHRGRGGLGLGLTLVKTLVELHGGSVSATSAGPGRGSTFEVRLPSSIRVAEADVPPPAADGADCARDGFAADGDAGDGAAADGSARANGGDGAAEPVAVGLVPATRLKVAVIEDNPDIRETLRELLRLKGHDVVEAEDGPGGVQLVIDRQPHVALVDIGLPGFDGYEVAARLRVAAGGTRLVALTGYGGEEDRTRAARAGFDAHLVKPVDFQDLTRVLDRLAGRNGAVGVAASIRGEAEGAAPCPS
ncbi:MAG TPA: response regulator [Anaeromyxobacter sp.]|nr:response regulator [Anaeromyxobacter sp.]